MNSKMIDNFTKGWIAKIQHDEIQARKDLLDIYKKSPDYVLSLLSTLQVALPSFAETFNLLLKEENQKLSKS